MCELMSQDSVGTEMRVKLWVNLKNGCQLCLLVLSLMSFSRAEIDTFDILPHSSFILAALLVKLSWLFLRINHLSVRMSQKVPILLCTLLENEKQQRLQTKKHFCELLVATRSVLDTSYSTCSQASILSPLAQCCLFFRF